MKMNPSTYSALLAGGLGFLFAGCNLAEPGNGSARGSTDPLSTAAVIAPGIENYTWSYYVLPGTSPTDVGAGRCYSNSPTFDVSVPLIYQGANTRQTAHLSGAGWKNLGVSNLNVDVGPDGLSWGTDFEGTIWQQTGPGAWVGRGKGMDVGIGVNGEVWKIGNDRVCPTCQDGWIYKWDPGAKTWIQVIGGGVRIDVDPSGKPWIVNWAGQVWKMQDTGNKFDLVQGMTATDIAIGSNFGSVFVLSTETLSGSDSLHKMYRYVGSSTWKLTNGFGFRLSVDYQNRPYLIRNDNMLATGYL
jgi:hypothetical protein